MLLVPCKSRNRDHLAPQVRAFIDWTVELFRMTEDQLIGRP